MNTANPTSSKIFMIQLFRVKHCILIYKHIAAFIAYDMFSRHDIPGTIPFHLVGVIPITVISIITSDRPAFEEGVWFNLPIYIIGQKLSSVREHVAELIWDHHWRPRFIVSDNAAVIPVDIPARIWSIEVHSDWSFVTNDDSPVYDFHIFPSLEPIEEPGWERAFLAPLSQDHFLGKRVFHNEILQIDLGSTLGAYVL